MTGPRFPLPHHTPEREYECAACGWTGSEEEQPTFCPKCGSVHVCEYLSDDYEPGDGDEDEDAEAAEEKAA